MRIRNTNTNARLRQDKLTNFGKKPPSPKGTLPLSTVFKNIKKYLKEKTEDDQIIFKEDERELLQEGEKQLRH